MKAHPSASPRRILFVCLGNIVRSPLAEGLFRHLAAERGVADKYEVDSAGTSAWHIGEPPDPRMRKTAAKHGVHYNHVGRQFRRDDFRKFDLILVMDHANYAALLALNPDPTEKAKIHYLREFDPQGGPEAEVPDPYYGGMDGFERVYRIVERSVRGLLDALESGKLQLKGT